MPPAEASAFLHKQRLREYECCPRSGSRTYREKEPQYARDSAFPATPDRQIGLRRRSIRESEELESRLDRPLAEPQPRTSTKSAAGLSLACETEHMHRRRYTHAPQSPDAPPEEA